MRERERERETAPPPPCSPPTLPPPFCGFGELLGDQSYKAALTGQGLTVDTWIAYVGSHLACKTLQGKYTPQRAR